MTVKISDPSPFRPAATPQGWFTWNSWSSLFSSFFSYLGSFVWTPKTPFSAHPFPTVVNVKNVEQWLGEIHFKSNLEWAQKEVTEGPKDQTAQRISDLEWVAQTVREKTSGLTGAEDWTSMTSELRKVDGLRAQMLANTPSYLPIVEAPPEAPMVHETFGLQNTSGNDCFMNTVWQMIVSSDFLVRHIIYGEGQHPLVKQTYQTWKKHLEWGTFTSVPGITNPLRSLHPTFHGSGQHDVGEFLLHALLAPLKALGNPLFFDLQLTTYYAGVEAVRTQLEEPGMFNAKGGKTETSPLSTIQIILPEDQEFLSMEDLFRRTANEICTEETRVRFEQKTGEDVALKQLKKEMKWAPPEFLFIHLRRECFSKETGRGYKNIKKVAPQEFFYLPPECTIDGRGAKYQWVSFGLHEGGYGRGHYVSYVHHEKGYHYYSDSTKEARTQEAFIAAGQDFYLGFAKKVPCDDVQGEMEEAERKGATHKEMGKAVGSKIGKARMQTLIELFATYLGEDLPDLHKLQIVYDQLDDPFKKFIRTLLSGKPRDCLADLKAIDLKLGSELSGNIVAQYAKIREQNLRISRDLKKERRVAEAEKKRLEHLQTLPEEDRLKVAQILDPGLEKELAVTDIKILLETNALRLELISRDETSKALREEK
ncbi:MAG: hypothetical protein H7A38_04590 [Chlamydiales bacterium]|nr:hypothetical protein [Chlamydiales bacterium]